MAVCPDMRFSAHFIRKPISHMRQIAQMICFSEVLLLVEDVLIYSGEARLVSSFADEAVNRTRIDCSAGTACSISRL